MRLDASSIPVSSSPACQTAAAVMASASEQYPDRHGALALWRVGLTGGAITCRRRAVL
jgi:hypothetical protein